MDKCVHKITSYKDTKICVVVDDGRSSIEFKGKSVENNVITDRL